MTFASLGLSQALLRSVAEQGYITPTPIQLKAIPLILQGRDLLAAAQTGTGKTAAFTLPLLQRLFEDSGVSRRRDGGPRALVLVPTRELALQVKESVSLYGKHAGVRATVVFGGVGIQPQVSALRRGVDILIATPGRLLDLIGRQQANLSAVEFLVLDEADRMLDMGFIHDLKRILGFLPKSRQNLLFSATFSEDIRRLAGGFLNHPLSIEVAPRNAAAERVSQTLYHVARAGKSAVLAHLLREGSWGQTLVFTRTKHGANQLAEHLDQTGFRVAVIHGNKSQSARTQALADFKADRVQILVATDIAARGLDIQQLPHVVNFELPHVPEDYVHRIGRTGRAGAEGNAVSLVCADEAPQLRSIERLLGRSLSAQPVPKGILQGIPAQVPQGFAPPKSSPRAAKRPGLSGPPNREPGNVAGTGRQQSPRPRGASTSSNDIPTRSQRERAGSAGDRIPASRPLGRSDSPAAAVVSVTTKVSRRNNAARPAR